MKITEINEQIKEILQKAEGDTELFKGCVEECRKLEGSQNETERKKSLLAIKNYIPLLDIADLSKLEDGLSIYAKEIGLTLLPIDQKKKKSILSGLGGFISTSGSDEEGYFELLKKTSVGELINAIVQEKDERVKQEEKMDMKQLEQLREQRQLKQQERQEQLKQLEPLEEQEEQERLKRRYKNNF